LNPHGREVPEFGLLLRLHRAEIGLTQTALAERAGMSTRGLQKLERGETLPYPDTVRRLEHALGLTAEQRTRFRAAGSRPRRGQPAKLPYRGDQPGRGDNRPAIGTESPQRSGRSTPRVDTLSVTAGPHVRSLVPLASEWVAFVPLGRAPRYADLLTAYEPLAAAQGDPGLLGAVYNRLGYCEWADGDLGRARATWTKAVELCTLAGRAGELAISHVLLQWCRLAQGDFQQVLLCHEQVLDAIEQEPSLHWRVWALAALGCAHALLGRRDAALGAGSEALILAEKADDPDAIACAHGALSLAHTTAGNPTAGQRHGTSAADLAHAPLERAWAQAALGWARCRLATTGSGLATDAVPLLESLFSQVQATNVLPGEISVMLFLAESYWRVGELAVSNAMLEAMIQRAERAGMTLHVGAGYRLVAEIGLSTDPTPRGLAMAATQYERSISLLGQIKAEPELALALVGYGRLHQRRQDRDPAANALARALAIYERVGGPFPEADALRRELATLRTP